MKKRWKRKYSIIVITLIVIFTLSIVVYGKERDQNNTPPMATIAAQKNSKAINVEILTDYTGQKLSDLNSNLNQFKADLYSMGVDANIDVINSNEQIGTYSYTSYKTKDVTVSETFTNQVPSSTYYYYDSGLSGNLNKLGNYTSNTTSYYVPPYMEHFHETLTFTTENTSDGQIVSTPHPYSLDVPNGSIPLVSATPGSSYDYTDSNGISHHIETWNATYDGDVEQPGYTVTTTTYTQVYTGTISGTTTEQLPIKTVDEDALKQKSFSKDNDKYFIYVSDGTGNAFQNGDGTYFSFGNLNKSFMNYLLNNDFTNYAVTPSDNYDYKLPQAGTKQELTIRQLVGSSLDGGKLFDKGQIQNALDDIKSRYAKEALSGEINYICTDESLTYNKTYSDAENDPQAVNSDGTLVERWRYDHDPTIYENNSGPISSNHQWINTPIDQFDKTGEYKITYQAEDDPSWRLSLGIFKMWSTGENQLILRVHHRPIADFTAVLNPSTLTLTIKDSSYDIDHESRADKGIVNREYKWKLDTDTNWTEGLPPSTVSMSKTYEIAERVQDMDGNNNQGAWSKWITKMVTIGSNNPPIARFSLDKNSMSLGEVNNITDTSYDPDGDSLSERHFWVIDANGNVVQDCLNYQPNLSTLGEGTYTIKEIVKDSPRVGSPLSSDPYYQTLTVEDLGLSASLYPNPAQQGQQVTFDINTTGYAKYLRIYLPQDITSLDTKGTLFPLQKTIKEEYSHDEKIAYILPLNTPLTLDNSGNRLREPYAITVEAEKASGKKASVVLYLDVKGSILDGLKSTILDDDK